MANLKWSDEYFKYLGDQTALVFSHIGLVDENSNEFDNTTVYERVPVTWEVQLDGTMTPTSDITIDVPGSGDSANPNKVTGFLVFDSQTGGTNYGGKDIAIKEYVNDGQYTLPQDKIFINFANLDV